MKKGVLNQRPEKPAEPARKGERTRARLLAATVQVLADIGYEGASALEIARAANVSNATFYIYFKSKAEVIDAAVTQVAHEITLRIFEDEQEISDLAGRVAYAVRRFISAVLGNASWARALLAAYAAVPELRSYISKYMLRTLHEGITEGAFHIDGSPLQVECLNAVVLLTVRMKLDGSAGPRATEECVELILRMLGVDHREAHALAAPPAASSPDVAENPLPKI